MYVSWRTWIVVPITFPSASPVPSATRWRNSVVGPRKGEPPTDFTVRPFLSLGTYTIEGQCCSEIHCPPTS